MYSTSKLLYLISHLLITKMNRVIQLKICIDYLGALRSSKITILYGLFYVAEEPSHVRRSNTVGNTKTQRWKIQLQHI